MRVLLRVPGTGSGPATHNPWLRRFNEAGLGSQQQICSQQLIHSISNQLI